MTDYRDKVNRLEKELKNSQGSSDDWGMGINANTIIAVVIPVAIAALLWMISPGFVETEDDSGAEVLSYGKLALWTGVFSAAGWGLQYGYNTYMK